MKGQVDSGKEGGYTTLAVHLHNGAWRASKANELVKAPAIHVSNPAMDDRAASR